MLQCRASYYYHTLDIYSIWLWFGNLQRFINDNILERNVPFLKFYIGTNNSPILWHNTKEREGQIAFWDQYSFQWRTQERNM